MQVIDDPLRLTVLHRLGIIGTPPEESFDRLTRLAVRALRAPIAVIAFVDDDHQFYKSCIGIPEPWGSLRRIPLSRSICRLIVSQNQPLVIEDLETYAGGSGVDPIPEYRARSYLGVPLIVNGQTVGAFAVADTQPRTWTQEDLSILTDLGATTVAEIERRAATLGLDDERQDRLAILESIEDAVLAVDQDWRVTYLNSEAIRLRQSRAGYRQTDVLGMLLWDVISIPSDSDHYHLLHRAMREQRRCRFELRGTITGRWFVIKAFPHHYGLTIQIQDVSRRKQAETALRDEAERLSAIITIQREIAAGHDLDTIMQTIAERAQELTHAGGALIEVIEHDQLVCRQGTGSAQSILHTHRPVTTGLAATCIETGDVIYCRDVERDQRGDPRLVNAMQARSIILVPLQHAGVVTGILSVISPQPDGFTERDIQTLRLMAGFIGDVMSTATEDEERRQLVSELSATLVALQDSEQRFRDIFAQAPVGQVMISLEGRFLQANRAFCQITGYPENELLLLDVKTISHPEDNPRSNERFRQLIRGEIPYYQLEKRFIRRDGMVVDTLLSASLVRDNDRQPKYVVALVQDMTERKRAEEALRATNQTVRALVQAAPLGIATLDEQGRIASWNPAAEHIFGWTEREVIGGWAPILSDTPEEISGDLLDSFKAGELVTNVELQRRRKNGTVIDISISLAELPDVSSGAAYMAIIADISERKQAEEALRESEERFRTVFESAPIGIANATSEKRYVRTNRALQEMLGYSEEELHNTPFLDLTHPDDIAISTQTFQDLTERRSDQFSFEKRFIRRDGTLLWVRLTVSAVRDEHGELRYTVSTMADITEQKRVEAALKLAEERYRELVEQMPAITYLTEPGNPFGTAYASPQIKMILGFSDEIWRNDPYGWLQRLHPEDHERVQRDLEAARLTASPYNLEYRLIDINSNYIWVQDQAIVVEHKPDGTPVWQGIMFDITNQKILEEQLTHQAFHDALTGLPNRTLFLDRLEHALVRANRDGRGIAVLFMDLDNFKVVNDSLGHDAGDQLLIDVAQRMVPCLRVGDTIARLGGDEFIFLLEDISEVDEAIVVVKRLLNEFKRPFIVKDREVVISATIGVVHNEVPSSGSMEILSNADIAMYRAKLKGKARHEIFDPNMHAADVQRLEIELSLRRAIEEEQFVIHYQPTRRLDTRQVIGLEALVRWNHPERGLIYPDEFISIAEETGLIVPLGQLVLREVCRQARLWQLQYPRFDSFVISVNLSALQLQQTSLASDIADILAETGLPAGFLGLEITENVVMEDAESTMETLHALKQLGIRLSIDDFGTGYSSLAYLQRFSIDALKIDRTFTSEMDRGSDDTVVISAMINLAHSLRLLVIAEGVESEAQLRTLHEMGCDFAQGYYLGRPQPGSTVTTYLSDGAWPLGHTDHHPQGEQARF